MKASPEFIDAIAHLKPCLAAREMMEAGGDMRDIFTMRPDWAAWAWVRVPYETWRLFPGIAEDLIRANPTQWIVRCRIGSLADACLDGANLPMANLTGANLAGANLAGAYLADACLDGANLTRANLTGMDLTDAWLTRANLAGANLAGANLTGANLTRANLTGCNFEGANLRGADFYRAYHPEGGIAGWKVDRDGRLVKEK
jgi:hypothetical protein